MGFCFACDIDGAIIHIIIAGSQNAYKIMKEEIMLGGKQLLSIKPNGTNKNVASSK